MIEFFNLLGKMLESGFTWAAIVAALSTLEKYYDKRQSRKMLYLIAKKVGVEWDTPQEELKKMAQLSYKKFYSLSRVATILRRITKMNLSGKKKILAIGVAILINGSNDVFGLGLSQNTITNISALGGGYVLVEAIIDVVRSWVNRTKEVVVVDAIPTIDGSSNK